VNPWLLALVTYELLGLAFISALVGWTTDALVALAFSLIYWILWGCATRKRPPDTTHR
jgi:hypothetical protein